jgi:diadenosine tetraphosphate (Ap4A) HIT family hydrolase
MNEIIYDTINFQLEVPLRPFVDRNDGGHIRIMSKINVRDRTMLNKEQMIEYTLLSMLSGEALTKALGSRGIDVGIINYQEMGNWSVFKPEGVTMHMHIFGRAKDARTYRFD